MKLSEAVRQGVPEITLTNDFWFAFNDDGEVCEGCLVGAALHGACVMRDSREGIVEDHYQIIYELWPWTRRVTTAGIGLGTEDMADILSRLCGGYLRRTRSLDEVVSIIEGLEAKYDPQPVQLELKPVTVQEEELAAV